MSDDTSPRLFQIEAQHGPFVVNDEDDYERHALGADNVDYHTVPTSVLSYRLAGRLYPVRSSPRCSVCQSRYRLRIEQAILSGHSYRSIERSLPEDAAMDHSAIWRHFDNGHLPLDEHVNRVAVEARAEEIGWSVKDHNEALADHITLAKVGVQKVFQRMANGEIEPDVKDGVAFANLLLKLEQQEGSDVDHQALIEAFSAYMQAAEAVMTPMQLQEFGQILASNEVMQGLLARRPGRELDMTSEDG